MKFAFVSAGVLFAAAAVAEGPANVWEGVYTEEQAERGKVAYEQGCAECHGAELEGDDMSPPLIGADFLWAWDGLRLGDLFERIRISMPDGDANSMTREEKADVIAFLLMKNEMPAGSEEMPAQADPLFPIAFTAVQP